MPGTEQYTTVKVKLPTQVCHALEMWADSDLYTTAEYTLELLAEELRAFTAGLVGD